MEQEPVVEAALHQRLDLRRVFGREIGAELDRDPAVLGVEIDGVLRVARGVSGRRRDGGGSGQQHGRVATGH